MKKLFEYHIVISWIFAIRQTLTALMARFFGFPLTCLIKRDPNLMVVINRPGTSFADNSKYFFIYATEYANKNEQVVMVTAEPSIKKKIDDAGGESALHPSFRSLCLLLRCGKVVTDMDWFNFGSYPLTRGAKLIQLWHGAPLKHIELDLYRKRISGMPKWKTFFLKIQKTVIGRYPVYDIVLATSQWFIDNAFRQCFKAKQFASSGYPRNDILFGWPKNDSVAYRLAMINVDSETLESVSDARSKDQRICLYAPTFRKDLKDPFGNNVDLADFSDFAQKNNLLIVLKLHPFMHGHSNINHYPNIIEYAPLCDVYPLMPLCDFLITDYSSIFFDFLLLDRPIVFFAYDLEDYLNNDRSMYFEYEKMTPGTHCHTYKDLELHLKYIIDNDCQDEYSEMRKKIRRYAHDHIDNQASQRFICEHLRNL